MHAEPEDRRHPDGRRPDGRGPDGRPEPDPGPDSDPPPADLSWRVPRKLPVTKIIGAATILAAGLLLADGDPVRLALAILAAASVTGWALRDLLVPVRLTAGPDGITVVVGFAGRRRLGWGQIEAITVDRRGHRGVRTELLEIDAGESLHLLGRGDLGTDPEEVAAALRALRSRSQGVTHPRRSRDEP